MKTILELITPGGIIALICFVVNLVKYPRELYESLTFKDTIKVGLLWWLLVMVAVGTISLWTTVILKQL